MYIPLQFPEMAIILGFADSPPRCTTFQPPKTQLSQRRAQGFRGLSGAYLLVYPLVNTQKTTENPHFGLSKLTISMAHFQ